MTKSNVILKEFMKSHSEIKSKLLQKKSKLWFKLYVIIMTFMSILTLYF